MKRVAFVTGGARRLGAHLSETLSARGYHVVVGYRSSESEADNIDVSGAYRL